MDPTRSKQRKFHLLWSEFSYHTLNSRGEKNKQTTEKYLAEKYEQKAFTTGNKMSTSLFFQMKCQRGQIYFVEA